MQIQPGKKNIKAAIKAALAEAQGYDDPDEPPVRPLEDMTLDDDDDDEDAAYGMSSPSTPSKRRCLTRLPPHPPHTHTLFPPSKSLAAAYGMSSPSHPSNRRCLRLSYACTHPNLCSLSQSWHS